MEKKNAIQNVAIIVLGIALIIMSVGYANYQQDLQINGDVLVKGAKWDIHFENIQNETLKGVALTGADKIAAIDATTHTVSFDVELSEPGDVYEFNVDVKNAGTFDAKLIGYAVDGTKTEWDTANDAWGSAVSIKNDMKTFPTDGIVYTDKVQDGYDDYLKYTITYDDDTPLADQDFINKKDGTERSLTDTRTLKIKVEYLKDDEHPEYAPEKDVKYHFEVTLTYEQI